MLLRDRIKDFRRIRASELRPSPKNWKIHPPAQKNALRGLLAEIGWAAVGECEEHGLAHRPLACRPMKSIIGCRLVFLAARQGLVTLALVLGKIWSLHLCRRGGR